MSTINVTLNTGATIPMRSTIAKSGNTYWGVLSTKADGSRYFLPYGVSVVSAVVGGSLPTEVKVLGQAFYSNVTTNAKGRATVKFSGSVTTENGPKVFTLTITKIDDDTYNVAGSIRGASGGGRKAVTAL